MGRIVVASCENPSRGASGTGKARRDADWRRRPDVVFPLIDGVVWCRLGLVNVRWEEVRSEWRTVSTLSTFRWLRQLWGCRDEQVLGCVPDFRYSSCPVASNGHEIMTGPRDTGMT